MTATRPSVLYVEDDEAIRDVTELILEDEFEVASVLTAEEAIERLRRHRYDVVLTDHNLPGNSGAWLLENAERAGLMRGAAGLVLTACTGRLEVAPHYPVLRKPIEFSDLVAAVHEAASRARSATRTRYSLYLSGSPASVRARRNLTNFLLDRGSSELAISVHLIDSGSSCAEAERDHVLEVPVLIRHGATSARLVGDLSDPGALSEFFSLHLQ